jgi:hypothetical protein
MLIVTVAIVIGGPLVWRYASRRTTAVAGRSAPANEQNRASPFPANSVATASEKPVPTPPSSEEIQKAKEQQWLTLFRTPISIYGKVVDENGKPVPAASVEIGINDNPNINQRGSSYTKVTEENGQFSMAGVHGISFSLRAFKEGYYTTTQSRGGRNVTVPTKGPVNEGKDSSNRDSSSRTTGQH